MREEPGIPPAGLPVDDALPERIGVLVLGGGLAGAAALLAAAEAGQYAVLLEKTAAFGGSIGTLTASPGHGWSRLTGVAQVRQTSARIRSAATTIRTPSSTANWDLCEARP